MKRALALALAVLLLGAMAYWMFGNRPPLGERGKGQAVGDSARADNVVGTVGAWRSVTSPAVDGFQFRITSPSEAEVDTLAHRDRRRLQFLYSGPNNEPPALTDGFTLTVSLHPRSPGVPLDTLVRRKIQQTHRGGGAVIRPVRPDSFHGRPARTWTQESALGTAVEHRIVQLGSHAAASIAVSVVGRDTARYQRTIQAMLRTLRFNRAAENTGSELGRTPVKTSRPTIRVSFAFLREPVGDPERGCDDVARVDHQVRLVESTGRRSASVRLESALQALLAIDVDSVEGYRHFLARTNETLSLDSASVEAGVARVYLQGALSGLRGVCDHPRSRIQLEETARALPAVDSVVFYRNGRRTDLVPSGRGRE